VVEGDERRPGAQTLAVDPESVMLLLQGFQNEASGPYEIASISPSQRGSSTLDPCFTSPLMLPSRKPRAGTDSSKVHGTF
jgi:hypothetical protein